MSNTKTLWKDSKSIMMLLATGMVAIRKKLAWEMVKKSNRSSSLHVPGMDWMFSQIWDFTLIRTEHLDLTENAKRAIAQAGQNSRNRTPKDMLDLINWPVKSQWPPKNIKTDVMPRFSRKWVSSKIQNRAFFQTN